MQIKSSQDVAVDPPFITSEWEAFSFSLKWLPK